MQGYNVIVVYSQEEDKLLLCRRRHDPYQGLSNFVGGKIEAGEDGMAAAYRELKEETGITPEDIRLTHFMDFTYYVEGCYVEMYVGKLNKSVEVWGEENELYWSGLDCDFFDMKKYAGEGNMGHMIELVRQYREQVLV
ncbi:MAG: NUDIX hydrolase [Eubacterium sp.]|nr:NUDIX hydrolase [Eubacterium sp.]MCM1215309.1 NUDIX hydrolase [Lachnospiraceae bacterium]MCM1303677.1 NUDIX hydrolase [Butyrivibrio sp.]MCM1344141.1 NUDIX hydrolase [Muribaculaceae bacterium]MCM1240209.1 NUDIX hydrolase [Lachnospiraceae bacterium]